MEYAEQLKEKIRYEINKLQSTQNKIHGRRQKQFDNCLDRVADERQKTAQTDEGLEKVGRHLTVYTVKCRRIRRIT
jgi:hypothetical protein